MGIAGPINGIQPFAELAQSATTIVYKGYQRAQGRFVLLKVLRPPHGQDEELVRRFEDEARLLARVRHPNVVAIYEYGRDGGVAYLAAEFVDGLNLSELSAGGPLPVALAVYVLHEAAQGLRAAHDTGVLHRDIKPANILVSHEGRVKLADFGMASLSAPDDEAPPEEVRGTLAYLAPEQVLGATPCRASDLFSLGATFFELLAGRPAFSGPDASALFDAVLHHDPIPFLEGPHLPDGVRALCRRLLAKKPEERYADTAALLDDLEALCRAYGYAEGAEELAAFLRDPETYRRGLPRTPAARIASPPTDRNTAGPDVIARPARPAARTRRRLGLALAGLLAVSLGYSGVVWMGDRGAADPPAGASTAGPTRLTARTPETTDEADASPRLEAAEPPSDEAPADSSPAPDTLRTATAAAPAPTDSSTLAVTAEDTRPGSLRVSASPWAVVFVDGDSIGTTPLREPLTLPPGPHEIAFRNPRFPASLSFTRSVEVLPGEAADLAFSFWDHVGQITLQVNPWAHVYVDDVYRDATPLDQPLLLAPGPHVLRLEHPQLGMLRDTIRVTAGTVETLRYNMREAYPP